MTLCKVSPRAGPSQQLILQVAKIQLEDSQPYWFEEPQDKFKVDPATRKWEGKPQKEESHKEESPIYFAKSLPKLLAHELNV